MDTKAIARQLRHKGARYWIRVLAVAILGVLLSNVLADHPPQWMLELRLSAYRVLETTTHRQPEIGTLAVVLISDEEYWKGAELQGRRPTKRGYIGKLVKSLCDDGAAVVALDFDLRSPVPDGSVPNHADYKNETDDLATAVVEAQQTCRIVLPAALNCPFPPDGVCTRDATVLDAYRARFNDHVSWGYINLPADIRQIPLRRANVDSGTLDSLSQALAAAGPSQYFPPRLEGTREFPYGSFISEQAFAEAHSVFRAGDIANNSPPLANVRGKSVLIGGSWHAYAFGRGPMVDAHVSPVGSIPGVYLHANYAAAILDGRYYTPAGKVISNCVDVITVAAIAVFFALPMGWPRRWLWVAIVGLAMSGASYLLWQNLGVFFEATIPCVLLFCHSLFDEYLKMREELVALRAQVAHGRGSGKVES